MKILSSIRSFASTFFHRARFEYDMDDELRAHIHNRANDLERSGLSRAEAERRARLDFGGYQKFKEECRESIGTHFVDSLLQDIRFALRMLHKSPGFTAVAILTLALGIGANTAIFSVLYGVVLSAFPYKQPNRLTFVWLYNSSLRHITALSYPDFLDWQRNARSFEEIAAETTESYDLTSPGTPEHFVGREISANFFRTLGVNLALGREFSSQEDRRGGAPVAIISYSLWKNLFGGNADVLGETITLNGSSYTVVGVLPAGFRFAGEYPVYTAIGQGDSIQRESRTVHDTVCIARLRTGVSMDQAQSEMNLVQRTLDQLYPKAEQGQAVEIVSLKEQLVGDARPTIVLLFGAVGFVLLIACANVANLLLARSAGRRREFALKLALGASRTRLVRQLITESTILSVLGGAAGIGIAALALTSSLRAMAVRLPRSENIALNTPVLLFTLALSVATGILFSLPPALKSLRADLQSSLKEAGRGKAIAHHGAQNSLIVVEMALTLILLAGAGLLFRTVHRLWEVNPGFSVQHVITFKVGLSPSSMNTPASARTAYRESMQRIRQIGAVQAADLTALLPLTQQDNSVPFWLGAHAPVSIAEAPRTLIYWTGPQYLRAMGIRLLRGRFIQQTDTLETQPVAVIDSTLANSYFPGQDPVGSTITFPHVGPFRVVGVVAHIRHWGLANAPPTWTQNQTYASLYQLSDQWMDALDRDVTVVVRTSLPIASVIPSIEHVIYGSGAGASVYDVRTMHEIASASMSPQRLPMILLAMFAGLGMALALIGIYGVVSYLVTQRTHEIGIRMALGATRRHILANVIGLGFQLAVTGVAIGAAASLILGRLLGSFSHLLYGVGTADPLTFAVVSLVLTGVAVVACYIPARRAMRVDPMTALRHE